MVVFKWEGFRLESFQNYSFIYNLYKRPRIFAVQHSMHHLAHVGHLALPSEEMRESTYVQSNLNKPNSSGISRSCPGRLQNTDKTKYERGHKVRERPSEKSGSIHVCGHTRIL